MDQKHSAVVEFSKGQIELLVYNAILRNTEKHKSVY